MTPGALVIQTPTPSQPPERREAARKIASLTLLVALVGLVAIVSLTLVLMRRGRKRLADAERARATRNADAWSEAGRRAGAPPAEAFESDEDMPHG